MIKRQAFDHRSSFRVNKIENLIKKMERKFPLIVFVKLRNTVEGKGLTRISKLNFENNTLKIFLPHHYTNNNKQAKLILGIKEDYDNIDSFKFELEKWLLKNA
ncbi:MAG: hypothetical protein U0354_15590 [Candidatus Sericytochromatia bacterium]